MLQTFDLSPVEQEVYETLLDSPPQTTGELGISADLVAAMEQRGLVSRVAGAPARYAAVAPGVALDPLLLQREQHLTQVRRYVQQLATRYREAAGRRDPAELVEIVTGRQAVIQRSHQIQRSARSEVRAIDKPPYANDPRKVVFPDLPESDGLRRGVRYRVIYDQAGLDQHDLHRGMEPSIAAGELARVLPAAPMKILIADDRIGWIPLQAAPTQIESIVVVHQSAMLEALGALFESLWQRALPLQLPVDPTDDAAGQAPADRPTVDEQRLLALLVAGMPDKTIARQLAIAPRTVHRRIHDLIARLGVQTRLQLGAQAALLGWVTRAEASSPPAKGDQQAGVIGGPGHVDQPVEADREVGGRHDLLDGAVVDAEVAGRQAGPQVR